MDVYTLISCSPDEKLTHGHADILWVIFISKVPSYASHADCILSSSKIKEKRIADLLLLRINHPHCKTFPNRVYKV